MTPVTFYHKPQWKDDEGAKEVLPRFELGLSDSESEVLPITP